jgi:hypothetical protein
MLPREIFADVLPPGFRYASPARWFADEGGPVLGAAAGGTAKEAGPPAAATEPHATNGGKENAAGTTTCKANPPSDTDTETSDVTAIEAMETRPAGAAFPAGGPRMSDAIDDILRSDQVELQRRRQEYAEAERQRGPWNELGAAFEAVHHFSAAAFNGRAPVRGLTIAQVNDKLADLWIALGDQLRAKRHLLSRQPEDLRGEKDERARTYALAVLDAAMQRDKPKILDLLQRLSTASGTLIDAVRVWLHFRLERLIMGCCTIGTDGRPNREGWESNYDLQALQHHWALAKSPVYMVFWPIAKRIPRMQKLLDAATARVDMLVRASRVSTPAFDSGPLLTALVRHVYETWTRFSGDALLDTPPIGDARAALDAIANVRRRLCELEQPATEAECLKTPAPNHAPVATVPAVAVAESQAAGEGETPESDTTPPTEEDEEAAVETSGGSERTPMAATGSEEDGNDGKPHGKAEGETTSATSPTPTGGDATPRTYLTNWREIMDCLHQINNDEKRRFVTEMNRIYGGPIKLPSRGGQPKVDKAKLLEWWNGLESQWETQGRGENAAGSVEEQYKYGKNETVVPEIRGHVQKRKQSGTEPRIPA